MNSKNRNPAGIYNLPYIYFICMVAALGGLMFGFDLGIITGVIPYIEYQFGLSGFSLGLVVALFELGAMTGALCSAPVSEKYGRKKIMIGCAVLFIITALGVSFASGALIVAIWRFAQGICVGAASVLSPMYIAEVTPAKLRGRMVSFNQLTIILGILIASLCNFYFGNNDLNSANWRFMFLSAIVPSGIFLLLLFFIPESPRWFILQQGKEEEADKVFLKINRGDEERSRQEINNIKDSIKGNESRSRVPLKVLFGGIYLPIMLIGFGAAFLQQFCGVNNVTPYMQKIFIMAGIQLKAGLMNAVLVQLVFFFSTFIAIGLVDKIGRKMLMLIGTSLMAKIGNPFAMSRDCMMTWKY